MGKVVIKRKHSWKTIFLHLSVMFVIIEFFLQIIMPVTEIYGLFTKIIVFTLTIFGGVGFYIIVGVKLEEIRREYGKE